MQIIDSEVADTGTGIEQNIVIDEHCRCAGTGADSATAAKNSYTHCFLASECSFEPGFY